MKIRWKILQLFVCSISMLSFLGSDSIISCARNLDTDDVSFQMQEESDEKEEGAAKEKRPLLCLVQYGLRGWKEIGCHTYFFSCRGVCYHGVRKDVSGYYFFCKDGELAKNRMIWNNQYVDETGKMIEVKDIPVKEKEGLLSLRNQVEATLANEKGQWSIYVKELSTNQYFCINDERMRSASLAKLYEMATVYDEIGKGNIEQTEKLDTLLKEMISASDNDAFNQLIKMSGGGQGFYQGFQLVNQYCEKYGYKNSSVGSSILPTKYESPFYDFNYTSTKDCGHLLERIYRSCCVSQEASEEMLDLLLKQIKRSKIPQGLPEGVICANKTGETDERQHDAAIVFSDGGDYIITIMTEDDKTSISKIRAISKLVYEYFNPNV